MADETNRTLRRISRRDVAVRSFFEKPSISFFAIIYVDLGRKYREKRALVKDNDGGWDVRKRFLTAW